MTNGLQPTKHLKHYGEVYPRAWEQAKAFRARKGEPKFTWPDWCFLPLAGAYAIISEEAARQGLISHPNAPLTAEGLAADVGNLGAVIAWRQTQGVYHFHETLYQSLWETPLDGDLPVELLYRLPEWCVWVDTDPASDGAKSPGFFAYLEYDMNTARPELRIALSSGNGLTNQILHLTERTIADCLAAGYREGVAQAFKHRLGRPHPAGAIEAAGGVMAQLLAPRVSLLLYLCTINAEVRNARGTGEQSSNPQPVKTRHGLKLLSAQGPARWEVGYRLGASLKAAQERVCHEPQGGTHAGARPHVRRAHWHTFLTGSGRQERVVKWLPPTPVNVNEEGDVVPTIKKVQE